METRSLSIDLTVEDAKRQAVLNSVRRYRAVCRQCYAVLLTGQAGGAELQENEKGVFLKPESDRSKILLATALGAAKIERGEKQKGEGTAFAVRVGSAFAYELRDYIKQLYPTALSFVGDSVRRDITTVWKSADPEFPKANRGWLAMQGTRGIAQFQRRGIGFPAATARPKLSGHALVLKWDYDIGNVTFQLPRLDGGRYYVWKQLRDGAEGWSLGTIYLSERDGKLFATLSYARPSNEKPVDSARILRLQLTEDAENWLTLAGPDGVQSYDAVSCVSALGWLQRALLRRREFERRKAACGSPRQPWGHRRANRADTDKLMSLTRKREKFAADWNHAWSRRVVARAVAWRCGTVTWTAPEAKALLFGHPWPWSQLREFLTYKLKEIGAVLLTE